jgi:2-dehydro-3-deoxyglucarate aldolase
VNANIAVLIQIENQAGVDAADEIAAIPGVDCLFVGPSDLAAALGHLGNPGHLDVQAAMRRVFDAAARRGKSRGILAPAEADARRYLEMGVNFVGVGSDLNAFRVATQALRDKYL